MERLEPKAPSEVRNYLLDWSAFLGLDTIATSDVVVAGVTLVNDTNDGTSATVKVSGGVEGTVARITNTITTAAGLTEYEIFTLPIQERSEPVTVDEAKAQLRIVDDNSEDALIASYIRSARAYVESESGYVFVRRQFVEAFNYWPTYISIGRRPVISIDEIEYVDGDGVTQPFTDYATGLDFRRIYPATAWPTLGNGGSVNVRYTAGFDEGEQAEELELARQAIFMLVGAWFSRRETISDGNTAITEVPFAVRSLIDRFRTQVI